MNASMVPRLAWQAYTCECERVFPSQARRSMRKNLLGPPRTATNASLHLPTGNAVVDGVMNLPQRLSLKQTGQTCVVEISTHACRGTRLLALGVRAR